MKHLVTISLILLLQACATVPVAYDQAASVSKEDALKFQNRNSDNDAQLIVIRDRGFVGSACKTKVFLDKDLVGKIGTSEKIEFWLPPSEYILAVEPAGICAGGLIESEVKLSAKQRKAYRVSISQNGEMRLTATSL